MIKDSIFKLQPLFLAILVAGATITNYGKNYTSQTIGNHWI